MGTGVDHGYAAGVAEEARAASLETLSDDEDKKSFTSPSPVRLPFQSLEEVAAGTPGVTALKK